jgi:phosphopantothenoylcysteine decarboxylase/phosphopantothenate--cysteine ligase
MTQEKSNLESTNILIGVSAGVSAYKALDLASRLTTQGYKLKTIMTENACRLVGPKSFEAVTASAVYTDMWATNEDFKISHIDLADWADMVVIAPATANIIGKAANGICDDLLSTILCTCWKKPTILAPAMNTKMWENPGVQANIEKLKKIGFEIVGPATGRLACGTEGIGRMTEPQDIIEAIVSKIKNNPK